nr:diadenylate cyclase CdaA [Anoxybacter fermentans]
MNVPLTIIINVIDILLVAFVFYRLILLIKGTRAIELIKGLFVLFLASAISARLQLNTINWLLRNTMTMVFVALPIVFQPELRRALEQIGRGRFFGQSVFRLGCSELSQIISDLTEVVMFFSKNRIGALIVIEREVGLRDYLEMGIELDAKLTKELLVSIFLPGSPLHDGAVIIRQDRIKAASCFLPLSDNPHLNPTFGTRHRAAVGVSEDSDALVIVVSEETGTISLAFEGKIRRYLDEISLKERLFNILTNPNKEKVSRFGLNWRKNK